jgi:CDP-diacylglycerol--glycerol-3-phosphate 3-phosphatidyltransferase
MLSATIFDRLNRPAARRSSSAPPPDDYAARRLENTVWARQPALSVYRGVIRFGAWLATLGITADSLTGASLLLAAGAGVAVATGHFVWAALIVLASGLCDALDGAVARANRSSRPYGALLDSTVDRLSDGFPLLGVIVYYAGNGALAAIPASAMMAAFLVSYVRARAEALGAVLPPLFMRRAERVALLVVTLLVAPVRLDGIAVGAPLLLVGVASIGIMSAAGAWLALRSARAALAVPLPTVLSEPSE